MLVPPENYGIVEEGIYRSAKLDPLNFAFLETLELKSLVVLDAEKLPRALLNYFEDKQTTLYYVGRAGLKMVEYGEEEDSYVHEGNHSSKSGYEDLQDWMILRPALVAEILEIIFNRSKHNVMVVDKTELIIGLIRKIQKWSFSSIISEYRLYAGNRSTYTTETYLELVEIDLVSFEENELQQQEETAKYNKGGIKMAAHRKSFSSRSSVSSLSQSIDDMGIGSYDLGSPLEDDMALSASPQIPHELLKLAKLRKLKKTISKDEDEDTPSSSSLPSLQSYLYYKTPGSHVQDSNRKTNKTIKVILPPESNLPTWFVRQRNDWESLYNNINK